MTMTNRSTLPIPDYDHLPLGSLESRIRTLDEPGLEALLTHESQHGDRAPVMNVLRQRLEALRGGARPSGAGNMPESRRLAEPEAKASPATQGPPQNPPSQGVPTNPAQPRT
jgi:hypothetical protein